MRHLPLFVFVAAALALPARADIPPPLISFSACRDYGLCQSCTSDLRTQQSNCAPLKAQGLEATCSRRSGVLMTHAYCRPGATAALVRTSGFHWLLPAFAMMGAAVFGLRWQRRRARPGTAADLARASVGAGGVDEDQPRPRAPQQ